MPTAKCEDAPASALRGITFPVKWRPPPLLPHCFPALGKPEFGARVCGGGHELQILSASHAPVCDPEGFEVHLVAGSFVVEAEVQTVGRVYAITDFNDIAAKTVPPDLQCRIGTRREGGGRGRKR